MRHDVDAALKGKRIVIADFKVVSAHPLNAPDFGATYRAYRDCEPDYPVSYFVDGKCLGEYGRPLDHHEIVEALVDAGMLS